MNTKALLYKPKHRWRVGIAFAAALLIHFAAIALANIHHADKPGGLPLTDEFPEIAIEEAPPQIVDLPPQDPEPLPTPAQTDESFPEERPTPPPVRRQTSKPVTPILKPTTNGLPGARTWSSAKVLAASAPRPEYPYEARRQKITGDGVMEMAIDPVSGRVLSVSMSKSTGSPFLDNAAMTALRRWRFRPGTVSSLRCPITFTLTGASY